MTSPIRALVHTITEFPKDPEVMTLRDCLEWWKRAVATLEGTSLSSMETKELNERWAFLCNAVAGREGVPTGSVSYFLGELAQAEMQLKITGDLEARETPDNV
jgi:hypothetical protein